jgi:hypothetical protein
VTESAETNGGVMSRLGNVGKWLSHPVVLCLVGVLISTLLVPYITRRWQETKEEIDRRAELAADITEKATGFAMAVQGFHLQEEARESAETPETVEENLIARNQGNWHRFSPPTLFATSTSRISAADRSWIGPAAPSTSRECWKQAT